MWFCCRDCGQRFAIDMARYRPDEIPDQCPDCEGQLDEPTKDCLEDEELWEGMCG